jgi:hypothetical protein
MKTFYFHLGERLGALPGFRMAVLWNPAFEAAFHHAAPAAAVERADRCTARVPAAGLCLGACRAWTRPTLDECGRRDLADDCRLTTP